MTTRREMRLCPHPFNGYKSSGPYKHEKNGRWHLNLLTLNGAGKHLNMTYAKYLVSIKEGRIPSQGGEVDHIDGDRTHDTLENLRVISKKENRDKANTDPPHIRHKRIFRYLCNHCGSSFQKNVKNAPHLKGNSSAYCCRGCSYQGPTHHTGLSFAEEEIPLIQEANTRETWENYSKGITDDCLLLSSNTLEDKKSETSKIVKSARRAPKVCKVCLAIFKPKHSKGQLTCSPGCGRILRYGLPTPLEG